MVRNVPGTSLAFVGVGANIEPEENIRAALAAIRVHARVTASSTFYRTKPLGPVRQADFINGVWLLRTDLGPADVHRRVLLATEARLGRRRDGDAWGPRTIDLDLLLYDDLVLDHPEMLLPHPDLCRPFVYGPVEELLAWLDRNEDAHLARRIRRLLPRVPSRESPGEALRTFTDGLRHMLGTGVDKRLADRRSRDYAGHD
jgi:2-amino-4-hydroxy-6-hydroxymethyldihydropteridine diphosphokinase